jgi:hypothetical protein
MKYKVSRLSEDETIEAQFKATRSEVLGNILSSLNVLFGIDVCVQRVAEGVKKGSKIERTQADKEMDR